MYSVICNPETNQNHPINSRKGRAILRKYLMIGGGKCSICGAHGVTKTTCPLNPAAKHPKKKKHNAQPTLPGPVRKKGSLRKKPAPKKAHANFLTAKAEDKVWQIEAHKQLLELIYQKAAKYQPSVDGAFFGWDDYQDSDGFLWELGVKIDQVEEVETMYELTPSGIRVIVGDIIDDVQRHASESTLKTEKKGFSPPTRAYFAHRAAAEEARTKSQTDSASSDSTSAMRRSTSLRSRMAASHQ